MVDTVSAPFERRAAAPPDRRLHTAAAMAGLLLLADLLFWKQPVGVSLALFAGAVLAAASWHLPPSRLIGPTLLLLAGAAPVVELVQVLSVAFLLAALIGAVVWARQPADPETLLRLSGRMAGRLPLDGGIAAVRGVGALLAARPVSSAQGLRAVLRGWAFPVGGSMVFAALLLDANPVLARLFDLRLDLAELAGRALFWAGVGLAVWPFLDAPAALPEGSRRTATRRLPDIGINATSTLRALAMFNVLIAVQTGLDLSILVGGADLPKGMTYAIYAHRGAYPLLATALLAGAFALAARPWLAAHRLIRPLMLLWLAQNVALALSALLRLDLYVGTYGVTYLRLYAMIWIVLVAAGLGLIAWQALRGTSNRWLVMRLVGMGLGTLYLCCFVNFAALIAAENLRRGNFDTYYGCSLGPMAAAVLADEPGLCPYIVLPRIEGWRDWGFREWRVGRYAEIVQGQAQNDHPDR